MIVSMLYQHRDLALDIAVGADGSEQVIAPDLMLSGGRQLGTIWQVPIPVPEGSRLSIRAIATNATTIEVGIMLIGRSFQNSSPMSRMTSYGVVAGDEGGVVVDPGGTANTKGAWAEIEAATANPMKILNVAIGNRQNLSRADANWLIDLGIGAGGSETVVIPDFYINADSNATCMRPTNTWFPVAIPEGVRLAVRAQCSINDATNRLFDVLLYGVD